MTNQVLLYALPKPPVSAFIHCPLCSYRAAGGTTAQADRLMTIHLGAVHAPQTHGDAA